VKKSITNSKPARLTPPAVPTVKEVAGLAGVSTATVSRVLTGAAGVREELVRRVRAAAQKLNYRPNSVARNLRVRGTRTIALVIPDIENPFFTSIVGGAEHVLQAANYTLLLANFNEDSEREDLLLDTLRAEGIAGMIFAPSANPSRLYQELWKAKLPMVAVSRLPDGLSVDLVTVENREGSRDAVRHLLALGHKRIGLINGPASLSTARERQAGFEQAFSEAGLTPPKDLVLRADFRQGGGYRAMKTLIGMPKRPTAVFVASNLMTLGALQAIHEHELDIPSAIAVVGFDDMPWATSLRPPLTVVAQPARELGVTAAKLLLDRLQEPARARRHIILGTSLVVRASSGSLSPSRASSG
jgi:DNA-binding LacI/PurR family transcriptional regulator